jgi:dihydroflavonol-4-reductase
MELPQAAGNRYICAGSQLWMSDLARILATTYPVPTRSLPYWLLWLVARFDPTLRLVLPDVGRREQVSAAKARRDLGWTMRPVEDTVLEAAASLVDQRVVAL